MYTYIYIYHIYIYICMNELPHAHYAFSFRILIGMIIWRSFCMFLRYELVLHSGWLLSRLWLTNNCPDFFDVRGNISYVDGSKLSRPKMDGWMVAKNQPAVYPLYNYLFGSLPQMYWGSAWVSIVFCVPIWVAKMTIANSRDFHNQ